MKRFILVVVVLSCSFLYPQQELNRVELLEQWKKMAAAKMEVDWGKFRHIISTNNLWLDHISLYISSPGDPFLVRQRFHIQLETSCPPRFIDVENSPSVYDAANVDRMLQGIIPLLCFCDLSVPPLVFIETDGFFRRRVVQDFWIFRRYAYDLYSVKVVYTLLPEYSDKVPFKGGTFWDVKY